MPVIAATPVTLASITDTAAPAIKGWIRLRCAMLFVTLALIVGSTVGVCLQ
jgi:hypothetical protein